MLPTCSGLTWALYTRVVPRFLLCQTVILVSAKTKVRTKTTHLHIHVHQQITHELLVFRHSRCSIPESFRTFQSNWDVRDDPRWIASIVTYRGTECDAYRRGCRASIAMTLHCDKRIPHSSTIDNTQTPTPSHTHTHNAGNANLIYTIISQITGRLW